MMLSSFLRTFQSWPPSGGQTLPEGTFQEQGEQLQDKGAQLQDIPNELVFQILCELPPSAVLAFALVSRAYHILSLPVLYDDVIICQQDVPQFLARISAGDPCMSYIHHVQVGRLDRPGYSNRWNLVRMGEFLSALPSLRTVRTVGGIYLPGWNGVFELAQFLGPSLLKLTATADVSPTKTDMEYIYTALKSLDLSFVQTNYNEVAPRVPSTLSLGFPNLVHLHLAYVDRAPYVSLQLPVFDFLAESHFPHLHTFSLVTERGFGRVSLQLLEGEYDALVTFLTRHASTLTVLALPSWPLPDLGTHEGPHIDSVPLTLQKLRAGVEVAAQLSEASRLHPGLEVLHLDYTALASEQSGPAPPIPTHRDVLEPRVNDLPPPSAARVVRITLEFFQTLRFGDVAAAFPELVELHMDLYAVSGAQSCAVARADVLCWCRRRAPTGTARAGRGASGRRPRRGR
ncbi:hypothetical protein B0H21DRAFT_89378 [Amylocystis lapponica]|nr:hypothetical protein B0H21DRAFT_89378 [Amylocystis lapponica]